MVSKVESALVGLVIIAIVLGASGLAYMMTFSNTMTDMQNRLSRLEDAISMTELYAGETDLYLKAKEEGTVIYYSFEGTKSSAPMVAAFEKRYPGIKVTHASFATTSDFIGRITAEHNAGQKSVDVVCALDPANVMKKEGWLVPYKSMQWDSLIVRDEETPIYQMIPDLLIYNTDLLAPEDVPSKWEDLTDPKYKGKIAMGTPLLPGRTSETFAMLKKYWNDDARWTNFVEGIKANEPTLFAGVGLVTKAVVAGEYPLGFLSMTIDYVTEKTAGSPVGYAQTDTACVYIGKAAYNDLAPHPNAAKLFIEFRLSVEGQTVQQDLKCAPVRADVPKPAPGTYQGGIDYWFPNVQTDAILVPPIEYQLDTQGWIDEHIKPLWT